MIEMTEHGITKGMKRSYLWNTVGSGLNAFYSPLFLMIVSRVLGIRDAGYFSLAFMTGMLLSNIGLFNVRSYQITDVLKSHADSVYLNARILTAGLMTICVCAYAFTKFGDKEMFFLILLLGLWRVPEVLSDVMHGTFQMNKRLDLAGKSLFIRACLCIVSFTLAIYIGKNLFIACALLVLMNILVFVFYDIRHYRRICPNHVVIVFNQEVKDLIYSCFPLFLISLIYAFLMNAQRYTIDYFGTPEIQTLFSILVLPASMIWVVFVMMLSPILPKLAELYFSDRHKEFNRQIRNIVLITSGFSVICLVLMYVIGIRAFEIVYKVPLMAYRKEFVIAGIGSGVLCVGTVFSYLLILIREKRVLLWAYVCVAVLSVLIGIELVIRDGLYGAALSYLITMVLLMLALTGTFAAVSRNRRLAKQAMDEIEQIELQK